MEKRESIFLVLLFSLVFVSSLSFNFLSPSSEINTDNTEVTLNFFNVTNLFDLVFSWDKANYSIYDGSLILMMDFNNNSNLGENDSVVVDLSRYGHNGSVLGGASYVSSGKYGGAYNFSEGEGINISASEDFNVDEFTISMWIKKGNKLDIKQVSVFGHTACLLSEGGEVYCTGNNEFGQLGDGTAIDTSIFKKFSINYQFDSFCREDYSNSYHNCGLLQNGTALCWGENSNGQLGENTTTQRLSPTPVYGDYNFSSLYCGRHNTCGLLQNGTALCWGSNDLGEIGDNTTIERHIPTPVYGNYIFSNLTTGDSEECGLLQNGTALCWGRNENGQVGSGNNNVTLIPTLVSGNYNFSKIFAGNENVCGILQNGLAMCWGNQESGAGGIQPWGALGTGDNINHWTPTYVDYNYTYLDLTPYYWGYLGLLTNGSLVGWGANYFGIIGNDNTNLALSPVFSSPSYVFSSISSGKDSIFGILEDGSLVSWGSSLKGVLGKGETPSFFTSPVLFYYGNLFNSSYYKINSIGDYVCFLNESGSAFCLGDNTYGQLGDNTTISSNVPVSVYGNYNFSSVGNAYRHNCGLLQNGTALCWGDNTYGQLGDNTTIERDIPTPVYGNYTFLSIRGGVRHTCGILLNGTALCWGDNDYGQLGDNNYPTDSLIPTPVYGNYNFSLISPYDLWSTCGLLQNGTALCWGYDNQGQLGDGTAGGQVNIPQNIYYENYTFSDLQSGALHTCGLLQNGTALCWGLNIQGQIGDGTSDANKPIPTPVYGNYNFSSISVGSRHTCGILVNGSLVCWGRNNMGQLGQGNLEDSNLPLFVDVGYEFDSIDLGHFSTYAILNDGRILTWGDNTYGQLGFLNFNFRVPTKSIYKGNFFGKDPDFFEASYTFEGDLKLQVNYAFEDLELDEEYNNVIVSYKNGETKIYKNGELSENFNALGFGFSSEFKDLIIGNNVYGQIDDLMMWNRTLSDPEIELLYKSSLEKVNDTSWSFTTSFSDLVEKTYIYGVYVKDNFGWVSSLKNLVVKFPVYSGSTGSSTSLNFNEGVIKRGFPKGHVLKFDFGNLIVGDFNQNKIILNFDSSNVEINLDESKKIDLDEDGFYDIQVMYSGTYNNFADLVITEIHEAVSGVISEVKTDINNSQGEEIEIVKEGFFRKLWNWIKSLFGK